MSCRNCDNCLEDTCRTYQSNSDRFNNQYQEEVYGGYR